MGPTNRQLVCLLVGASLPFVLACSSTPPSGIADGPPTDLGAITDLRQQDEVTVVMADNVYTPRVIRVDPGAVVTFRNEGANVHNATPNEDGALVAVSLSPTDSGTMTVPTAPGTYRYFCTLHATSGSGLQRGAFVVE